MRTLITLIVCLCVVAGIALAAPIDGKWVSERKMERDGQSFTIVQTFDLKSQGNTLTGNLTMQFGDMDPITVEIKDGKIDGANFSFTTVMDTPGGEFKISYKGTVQGDALKGTSQREEGEPRPFEAKRK